MSGEVPRYTGIVNASPASPQSRASAPSGAVTANIVRYFPTQAFNFAFKDTIKELFPSYSTKTDFWPFFAVNMASGGLAGAGSLLIVYPLDFARTRLAADVGSGKGREFNGLIDCLTKVAKRSGPMSLYQGFGVSVQGIIDRGAYFGLYDTGGALLTKDLHRRQVRRRAIATNAAASSPTPSTRFAVASMTSGGKKLTTPSALSRIYSQEGAGAFFKGAFSNVLRGVGGTRAHHVRRDQGAHRESGWPNRRSARARASVSRVYLIDDVDVERIGGAPRQKVLCNVSPASHRCSSSSGRRMVTLCA